MIERPKDRKPQEKALGEKFVYCSHSHKLILVEHEVGYSIDHCYNIRALM